MGPLKDKRVNVGLEPEGKVLNEPVFAKEKDMGERVIREGYTDILGHGDIKKEVLGVLKNIMCENYQGPD